MLLFWRGDTSKWKILERDSEMQDRIPGDRRAGLSPGQGVLKSSCEIYRIQVQLCPVLVFFLGRAGVLGCEHVQIFKLPLCWNSCVLRPPLLIALRVLMFRFSWGGLMTPHGKSLFTGPPVLLHSSTSFAPCSFPLESVVDDSHRSHVRVSTLSLCGPPLYFSSYLTSLVPYFTTQISPHCHSLSLRAFTSIIWIHFLFLKQLYKLIWNIYKSVKFLFFN